MSGICINVIAKRREGIVSTTMPIVSRLRRTLTIRSCHTRLTQYRDVIPNFFAVRPLIQRQVQRYDLSYPVPADACCNDKQRVPVAITRCEDCGQETADPTKNCANCAALQRTSPFVKFAAFYFLGGLIFVVLYGMYADRDVAIFVAANWLALGISVACIAYGLPRKNASDVAGLIYIVGLAWLALLLAAGIALVWTDGIGVQELRWLLD